MVDGGRCLDVQLERRASRVWTKTKFGSVCSKKRFFGRRILITERTFSDITYSSIISGISKRLTTPEASLQSLVVSSFHFH